jgi:hypothetical protein
VNKEPSNRLVFNNGRSAPVDDNGSDEQTLAMSQLLGQFVFKQWPLLLKSKPLFLKCNCHFLHARFTTGILEKAYVDAKLYCQSELIPLSLPMFSLRLR